MDSTTPPSSGGLFFPSSSPEQALPSPSEEVEAIVAQASKQNRLDSALEAVISSNQCSFFATFTRRIELIKSRSQAFQDYHITVFDKALLELTQNGNNLRSPSAIIFFCEEHLGISPSASASGRQHILADALALPQLLNQDTALQRTQRESPPTKVAGSVSPEKKRLIKTGMEEQKPAILATLAARIDSLTLRLWTVYEKAKYEFFSVSEPSSIEKQDAAKFLRDTAENTLHYLSDKQPDSRLVDELEITLATAKHTAMTLHGGKKRKFDESVPSEDRSRVSAARMSCSDPVDIIQAGERHGEPARAQTSVPEKSYPREMSVNRNEAPRYRDRYDREEVARNRRSFVAPELSPRVFGAPKRRKQQSGRGHSGIPYGYSRPVDSYHPGNDI